MENVKNWTDVVVTKELLNKKPEDLTSDEKHAIEYYNTIYNRQVELEKRYNSEIQKDCKILCSGMEKVMIPSPGWSEQIKTMCYKLEQLNIDYKKYGCYVNVSQSKTKFAMLCFYHSIHIKKTGIVGFIVDTFKCLGELLNKINYGRKYVTDVEYHETVEWDEITKECYDNMTDNFGYKFRNAYYETDKNNVTKNILNTKTPLFKENDKYYKGYILCHSPKTHVEITKHKFLFYISKLIYKMEMFFHYTIPEFPSKSKRIHRQCFQYLVDECVDNCVQECSNHCERCGDRLRDDYDYDSYYTKCYAIGWNEYLCRRCAIADESQRMYINLHDKKWYVGDKEVEGPDERIRRRF